METVAFILSPLIDLLRILLEAINGVISSYGFSIILLSLIVRFVTIPITRMAARADQRHNRIQMAMEPALAEIRATSTGRERFDRTEALYQEHRYHPIKSVLSFLPLFLQLPFLLAALILLTNYAPLEGQPFLFLSNLAEPDRLLRLGFGDGATINILPLLLTGVAVTESFVRRNGTKSSRTRFIIVSTLILILIYRLPAAVCLYWFTSNTCSLFSALDSRKPRDRKANGGSLFTNVKKIHDDAGRSARDSGL